MYLTLTLLITGVIKADSIPEYIYDILISNICEWLNTFDKLEIFNWLKIRTFESLSDMVVLKISSVS